MHSLGFPKKGSSTPKDLLIAHNSYFSLLEVQWYIDSGKTRSYIAQQAHEDLNNEIHAQTNDLCCIKVKMCMNTFKTDRRIWEWTGRKRRRRNVAGFVSRYLAANSGDWTVHSTFGSTQLCLYFPLSLSGVLLCGVWWKLRRQTRRWSNGEDG